MCKLFVRRIVKQFEMRNVRDDDAAAAPHTSAGDKLSQEIFRLDEDNHHSRKSHFNTNHDAHILATPAGSIALPQGTRRAVRKDSFQHTGRIPPPNDDSDDTTKPATTLRGSITTHNVPT